MPISTRNNRILTKNGKIVNRYIKTLTFQVEGDRFPIQTAGAVGAFYFESSEPNTVTVNYGDGTVETYDFFMAGSTLYRFGYRSHNDMSISSAVDTDPHFPYIFQDNETGIRNITFEFKNLTKLVSLRANFIELSGNFPVEVVFANNLKEINLSRTNRLNAIPNEVVNIPSLEAYGVSNAFLVPPASIPSGLFNSNLKDLDVSGTILTDNTSSNFFFINQLSDTLTYFGATRSQIEELPNELFECTLLYDLRLEGNNFKEIDERINLLINLNRLYFGSGNQGYTMNISFPDWNNLTNLVTLYLDFRDVTFDFSDIPQNWTGLKSLSQFSQFNAFCRTDAQFNAFIPYFYQLITENAFVNPTSAEALADDYPNQFRNIAWGHGSLAVDSPVEAHPDYISGQFFGASQTNGQRVYELIDNYGHVITYA